ncbi:hypothetical protein DES39_0565 [Orbus hercynius]|uniref:Uncharacterized protein n=1 Tax=Orbus hercynius TaxID=593135 RepID=A0A495RJ76_9GAMM|nr:hypothetical protein [Orbus hercynius]RKS87344.1 hypothetical protein DES39_0565 [Orbus hercynius]
MIRTTSLLLDDATWDIKLDDKGNIATVSNPYAIAQNVACAVSTFLGESIADRRIGIDYQNFQDGKKVQYLSFLYMKEAKRVNHVMNAKSLLYFDKNGLKDRKLSGVITIQDTDNQTTTLTL